MPGTGVVPRVAAFGCGGVEPLDHGDRPLRLQPAQQRTQRGAHDPRPDQRGVDRRGCPYLRV